MGRLLWILVLTALVVAPLHSQAEVVVFEDEVIFTLSAPGARGVFLVGDFNNWNATLEKMDHVGDVFEIRLFLVPGIYRYQFVVDGEAINDPDNPLVSAERGSVITLVMRAGMLALGNDEPVATGAGSSGLTPTLRYAGAFSYADDKTESRQAVDLFLNYDTERLRSQINFKSTDDSWKTSPLTTDIRLNDGFVEIQFGNAMLGAFENQETWASADPFNLVGDVGIYDYNAGLGRTGGALILGRDSRVKLRVLYTDRTEARLSRLRADTGW